VVTKILCIDDNELGSNLIRLYLARVQYESVLVKNGIEGLAKAREIKPDVIIVDLMMPKDTLDGWDTIAALKSDDELAHIPVIAMSALSVEHAKKRAFEAGCDAYVNKPSTPAELKACIDNLLGKAAGKPPSV
jgi:two-component system cell cycle response regulator DivK